MQQSIFQIRDKLLAGLDQNYNVVDLECVLEVLTKLESYSITKEALEATRLGKHINELRRNTNDQLLANRAKALVKKWRKLLVNPPQSGGGAPPTSVPPSETSRNGSRQCSPAFHPVPVVGSHNSSTHNSVGKTSKTATNSPTNGSSLAVIHPNAASASLPSSRSTSPGGGLPFLSRPTSPDSRPISPSSQGSNVSRSVGSHKRVRRSNGPLEEEPQAKRSRPQTTVGSTSNGGSIDFQLDSDTRDSFLSNGSGTGDHSHHGIDSGGRIGNSLGNGNNGSRLPAVRTAPADRKSRRSNRLGSRDGTSIIEQQMQSARKTGKVRTTQEIVQELALRSHSPRLGDIGSSVSVGGQASLVGGNLAHSKDQMMNQFLAASMNGIHSGSGGSAASSHATSPIPEVGRSRRAIPPSPKLDSVDAVMAQLPVINAAEVLAPSELSENDSEHDEDVEMEGLIPVKREPQRIVDESFLQKVHEGHLESVNGNADHNGEFCEWHEIVSKQTMGGELLYVLPYCVID